jgi:hypothetical protein
MRSVEDKIQDLEDQKQRIKDTIAFGCGHTEREEILTMGRTKPNAWMSPRMCDKCMKPLSDLYELCEKELAQLNEQRETKYAALKTHARLFHTYLYGEHNGRPCCSLEDSIETALSEYANVKLEEAAKMLEVNGSPIMANAIRTLKDQV